MNITLFHRLNIIDTCSVLNILSSKVLSTASNAAGCHFFCTYFVEYEVLYKRHSVPTPEKAELQSRFRAERAKGNYQTFHLELDDLLDVEVLQSRKNLGMGELSAIVFAKKMGQAFLTDDLKARRLASQVMDVDLVQTTPKLFGWLMFNGQLSDIDKGSVISEHERFGRPLAPWFEETYISALQYRLASAQNSGEG